MTNQVFKNLQGVENMSNKIQIRNESIAFCSLTIAWPEAGVHTDSTGIPPHKWLLSVLLVFSEWSPWQSRTSDGLALESSMFSISKLPYMKRSFYNIFAPQREERVENYLTWWHRT